MPTIRGNRARTLIIRGPQRSIINPTIPATATRRQTARPQTARRQTARPQTARPQTPTIGPIVQTPTIGPIVQTPTIGPIVQTPTIDRAAPTISYKSNPWHGKPTLYRTYKTDINTKIKAAANTETNYKNGNGNGKSKRIRDPSEKLNFIKRIWIISKDVTHRNNYDDVIEKYQKILKLPSDPNKLTDADLRLFIVPKARTRRWRNLFSFKKFHKFETPTNTITSKNRKRMRNDLTQGAIRSYQLNAYNELIGIMIVLMEKARDKYTKATLWRSLGYRSSIFSKDDSGGIIKIDNLKEEYVQEIFGYNIDEKLRNVYISFKSENPYNPTSFVDWIKKNPIKTVLTTISYLVIMSCLFLPLEHTDKHCPNYASETTLSYTDYSWRGKARIRYETVCKTTSGAIVAMQRTRYVSDAILIVGQMTTEQILSISLAHGIPTAIILSYKLYKMYQAHKHKNLLKHVFVDIHKTIFNKENTLEFDEIKDELFIYTDIFSDDERNLFDTDARTINHTTPNKNLYKYASTFLEARKKSLEEKARKVVEQLKQNENEKVSASSALGE